MKLRSTLLLLFAIALLCNYGFSQHIVKEGLPPDFNCTGCVLVILKKEESKNEHKFNEKVEKNLVNKYDGKSIFVTATELQANAQYADTSVYRFLLDCDFYTYTSYDNNRPVSVTGLNFHLYDRFTKKGYPQLSNYPAWTKNMEKIAEALNKLLKK